MSKKLCSVNTHFWNDNYIVELSPFEKLIFLYLITNPAKNLIGVFEISIRKIHFDTGIDKNEIEKILAKFQDDGKILFVDGWICLINNLKNQTYNLNMMKNCKFLLSSVPNKIKSLPEFQKIIKQYFNDSEPFPNPSEPLPNDSEPFPNPSEPLPNDSSNRKKERKKERELELELELENELRKKEEFQFNENSNFPPSLAFIEKYFLSKNTLSKEQNKLCAIKYFENRQENNWRTKQNKQLSWINLQLDLDKWHLKEQEFLKTQNTEKKGESYDEYAKRIDSAFA